MTVLVKKSTCIDCTWRSSCTSFKKVDGIRDSRDNSGHKNDTFQAIIIQCSMKNYDRSYREDGELGMYYCTECSSMHHAKSRIGKLHKKAP